MEKVADGEALVVSMAAQLKVAQAEGEKQRSTSFQAALDQAARLKVLYANKVKRYAREKGIPL